ncbi:exonuclease II [Thelephora terrestris]|uniref:5'-3' exoribonuclease 1 n=1 Tax=Thelephora terrestris TaxID=56493 RepID=A0A9P6L187_9AGAM|nr:exonuclease II [Thelephora terrestris]
MIRSGSHPNDEDAHFRLSEEQIFTSIFSYVDHLFGKIKPKKLFFMAVDGVAPRAKMNQQRSRRFKTAKEAREVREKAERKGEKLPDERAFDSNCITPGTVFMAKLSEQLKYFVNKKISEDSNWRECQVILSGHEVPGEGEHKIMEYIRKSRAQPDYNPNVRHCLYGLDADLIMLGLLSHDPHFCLLREEVKFGPARKKHNAGLESINFYLLHLTLMREYLDLEFREIETILPFDYSLERVIDDFILLAVFVGNDFLPHLPDVHIHENGLERLFEIYKQVLPSLDGYLNESGAIDTVRLQVLLDRMQEWEQEIFQREYSDMNWIKGKQSKHSKPGPSSNSAVVMTPSQRMIFDQVKSFVLENRSTSTSELRRAELSMPNLFSAREREFLTNLARDLHLTLSWDEYDEEDQNLVVLRFPESALDEQESESDSQDEAATVAVDRVLKKYDKAKMLMENAEDNFDAREQLRLKQKMDDWKREYYSDKLRLSYDDYDQMNPLIFRYIEGLQWVMHYYYSGVCSWGWFYDYHYAPRISDFVGVDKMVFHFELGKPFRPFEQLMGVLPEASKELVPPPYRPLMYDVDSPILDFYPKDFEQDLNGKKQEWEAVVKIPFIDENRLLQAMASKEHKLTEEERGRNRFGTSLSFSFHPGPPTVYASSLPGFFPAIHRCQCVMEPYDLPILDGLHLVQGLCDGVLLGAESLAGFPSLKTIHHHATLGHHGVNIHGTESRNKSMVIHVKDPHEGKKTQEVAEEMIGQRVFIGWPFLQEGKVTAVSDSLFKYEKAEIIPGAPEKVVQNPHPPHGVGTWRAKAERIETHYSKRCGVITDSVEILVHVVPLKGMKPLDNGAFIKEYETQDKETEQAAQLTITSVASEDPRYLERVPPPLSEEFPIGTKVFFLGEHAYGTAAQISGATDKTLSVILAYFAQDKDENEKFKNLIREQVSESYYPLRDVAEIVGLSPKVVSKLTSRVMAVDGDRSGKMNLGLSLKFEGRAQKVVDYSRKPDRYWEFSQITVDLIREYKEKFPELSEVFPGPTSGARVKELKAWLVEKGVRDFEPVPLNCDKVGKETVRKIEELVDQLSERRTQMKKVIVNGIPRQAVLKPAHAIYRLQNQQFEIGDRIAMVKDSGSVPLSIKGVVIGINAKTLDVVWDVSFMSGSTLGDRCSQYRGATVEFNSCLNLSNPQVSTSTNPSKSQQSHPNDNAQRGIGQRQTPPSVWKPPVNQGPIHIMENPQRGRGGAVNGRRGGTPISRRGTGISSNHQANGTDEPQTMSDGGLNHRGRGGLHHLARGSAGRGGSSLGGRGGFAGGRGVVPPARGGGGFRGRGRGQGALWTAS